MREIQINSEFLPVAPVVRRRLPYLNIVLYTITVITLLIAGLASSYEYLAIKNFGINVNISALPSVKEFLLQPQSYRPALAYALSLMAILGFHELGHYFACKKYRVKATLPYFLPGIPPVGTFGAFIKIKALFPSRKATFDIGISGPLAGFAVALPVTFYGILHSIPVKLENAEVIQYGQPLLMTIMNNLIFPNIPSNYGLFLHPVAFAGWVGLFATGLNLIPIGQMDGGHISYALFGGKSAFVGKCTFLLLLPFLYFSPSVLIWGIFFFLMKFRHPSSQKQEKLDKKRKTLAGLSLVIFILSFVPVPVHIPEWTEGINRLLLSVIKVLQ